MMAISGSKNSARSPIMLALVFACLSAHVVGAGEYAPASDAPALAAYAPAGDLIVSVPAEAEGREMLIDLRVPEPRLRRRRVGGNEFHIIDIPGYGRTVRPGWPMLPEKGFYIAVPEGASLAVEVLGSESAVRMAGRLCPAPEYRIEAGASGSMRVVEEYRENGAIYSSTRFHPGEIARIGPYGWIRDRRVAVLHVSPVRYAPRTGELLVHRRIRLRITMRGGRFNRPGKLSAHRPADGAPFDGLFRKLLLNFTSGFSGGSGAAPEAARSERESEYLQDDLYKLTVTEDGIHTLGYQDLTGCGIDPSAIDPRTVRIYLRGVEVPLYIPGEDDGVFDEDDYIAFHGEGNRGAYCAYHIYWLSWGGTAGLRMAERAAAPGDSYPVPDSFRVDLPFEKDERYYSNVHEGEGKDHWFWAELKAPPAATAVFPIMLDVDPLAAEDAEIRIVLHGKNSLSHRTHLLVNNSQIADLSWSGMDAYDAAAVFSGELLHEGRNQLTVQCPSVTVDQFFVNRFELFYWRPLTAPNGYLRFTDPEPGPNRFEVGGFSGDRIDLFDVSDPLVPVRLTGHTSFQAGDLTYTLVYEDAADASVYIALNPSQAIKPQAIERYEPAGLRSSANRADYVIITHEEFMDAIQPLADLRRSDGLAVTVAGIGDVYDEFAWGETDPQAIRDFLSYAYHHWQRPAPSYVLLAGDASYDYKGNIDGGNPNYVPTHLFISQSEYLETASDDWFTCIAGDDRLPDMLVGRLTGQTAGDIESQVAKIAAYEAGAPAGDWHGKILLIADPTDEGGDFESVMERLADDYIVPAGCEADICYVRECNPNCRSVITGALDEGRIICNFIGHGSIDLWSKSSIFTSPDVASLANGDRLPFVVTFDCLNGFFHHATDDYCIAEEFVRAPGIGAVACWSHSGLDYCGPSGIIGGNLYETILIRGDCMLGSAVYRAKAGYLALEPYYWDQAVMLTLFGDPALRLSLPERPDLLPGYFAFRPASPVEGGADTLTVTVFNTGTLNAVDAWVRFTDGHPDSSGSSAIGEVCIPSLAGGDQTDVSVVWDTIPGPGSYCIAAHVDFGNEIVETAEWNNVSWDTLRIRAAHEELDTVPPVVELYIDDARVGGDFRDNDFASPSPIIEAVLTDGGSGINTGCISLMLNGETTDGYLLEHEGNGSERVRLLYEPQGLEDGGYELRLACQDCSRDTNYTDRAVRFTVETRLILTRVRNYPNPLQDGTTFTFYLSRSADDVVIRIYSVTGALVKSIRRPGGERNANSIPWNGTDGNGRSMASGIYFYTVSARGIRGRHETAGKLVIVR